MTIDNYAVPKGSLCVDIFNPQNEIKSARFGEEKANLSAKLDENLQTG